MFHRTLLVGLLVTSIASGACAAAAEWETNYAKALAKAKAENRRVLLDFTGSDWCPPCMALRKQVFSNPAFSAYAQKKLILVEVDYPKRKMQSTQLKSQNDKLGRQYGINDKVFPTIVLLDSAGKTVREFSGYDGETAADLIAWIEGKKRM